MFVSLPGSHTPFTHLSPVPHAGCKRNAKCSKVQIQESSFTMTAFICSYAWVVVLAVPVIPICYIKETFRNESIFLNVGIFDYTAFAVSWKDGYPLTGSTTPVTPIDRPKSARNRCVIEVFGGVFVLSIGFRILCWYRGVCHRSESDLLLFLVIETE